MVQPLKLIKDIRPFLGTAHYYEYNGRPFEGNRSGNTYALHFFLGGKGVMIVDGKRHPVEKGTLMFIRPGQLHSFHCEQSPLPSYNMYFDLWEDETEVKSLQPSITLFPQGIRSELWSKQQLCTELDSLPTRFVLLPFPQLLEGFARIQQIEEQSAYYRQEAVNSLLYSLILQWYNAIHSSSPKDKRIIQMIAEMERYPESQLPYEEWCRRCGLQKSHFYKLFKKETGLHPKAYLLKVKMKKAEALLLESNKSITAIAEELGYSSIHYFSKQFHDYFRVTPSSYRNGNIFDHK